MLISHRLPLHSTSYVSTAICTPFFVWISELASGVSTLGSNVLNIFSARAKCAVRMCVGMSNCDHRAEESIIRELTSSLGNINEEILPQRWAFMMQRRYANPVWWSSWKSNVFLTSRALVSRIHDLLSIRLDKTLNYRFLRDCTLSLCIFQDLAKRTW